MKNTVLRFKFLAAALVVSALSLSATQAALITLNYNFTASGFGAGAPFDPVTGSFSVTFNNAASITNSASLFATISIPAPGGIRFSYDQARDLFSLGGALNGADQATTGTNDFIFILGGASSGAFTSFDFVYTTATAPGVGFFAQNIRVTQAVPDEASSLGLLALTCTVLMSLRRLRPLPIT